MANYDSLVISAYNLLLFVVLELGHPNSKRNPSFILRMWVHLNKKKKTYRMHVLSRLLYPLDNISSGRARPIYLTIVPFTLQSIEFVGLSHREPRKMTFQISKATQDPVISSLTVAFTMMMTAPMHLTPY